MFPKGLYPATNNGARAATKFETRKLVSGGVALRRSRHGTVESYTAGHMSADHRLIIEELFSSAGQRQPVVRGAFLEEASEGDEELRREVELLLSNPEVSPAEWAEQAIEERYPPFVALLGRACGTLLSGPPWQN